MKLALFLILTVISSTFARHRHVGSPPASITFQPVLPIQQGQGQVALLANQNPSAEASAAAILAADAAFQTVADAIAKISSGAADPANAALAEASTKVIADAKLVSNANAASDVAIAAPLAQTTADGATVAQTTADGATVVQTTADATALAQTTADGAVNSQKPIASNRASYVRIKVRVN